MSAPYSPGHGRILHARGMSSSADRTLRHRTARCGADGHPLRRRRAGRVIDGEQLRGDALAPGRRGRRGARRAQPLPDRRRRARDARPRPRRRGGALLRPRRRGPQLAGRAHVRGARRRLHPAPPRRRGAHDRRRRRRPRRARLRRRLAHRADLAAARAGVVERPALAAPRRAEPVRRRGGGRPARGARSPRPQRPPTIVALDDVPAEDFTGGGDVVAVRRDLGDALGSTRTGVGHLDGRAGRAERAAALPRRRGGDLLRPRRRRDAAARRRRAPGARGQRRRAPAGHRRRARLPRRRRRR